MEPDHPRIRGEHVAGFDADRRAEGSSPHTRGAPRAGQSCGVRGGIIPAYAGSTPTATTRTPARPDHPRIRGEHSGPWSPKSPSGGSSPHTRGALCLSTSSRSDPRIIPAYAGSTGHFHAFWRRFQDHPRIRGEHLAVGDEDTHTVGSSPHTRGAPLPQARGGALSCGSSPHTRGARTGWRPGRRSIRIIPAYAGSTRLMGAVGSILPDHPRIRGEHLYPRERPGAGSGSSPHTRGAQRILAKDPVTARIIPAYAGSTLAAVRRWPSIWDHPRIRGEHDTSPGEKSSG